MKRLKEKEGWNKELLAKPIDFTVKSCSGRQVTVDIKLDANTSQYDSYVIRWADGAVESKTRAQLAASPFVHSYNSNGQSSYNIVVYGMYDTPASCEGQRRTVSTGNLSGVATAPIINRLTTTGENTITLNYQVGNGSTAQLYQKDANGMYVATGQTGNGGSSFVVNTNTKQVQCFQVVTQDACNNAGVRSGEVCSIGHHIREPLRPRSHSGFTEYTAMARRLVGRLPARQTPPFPITIKSNAVPRTAIPLKPPLARLSSRRPPYA